MTNDSGAIAGVTVAQFTLGAAPGISPQVNWSPHGGGTGTDGAYVYPGRGGVPEKFGFWLDAVPIVGSDVCEGCINVHASTDSTIAAGDSWDVVVERWNGAAWTVYQQATNLAITAGVGATMSTNILITASGYYNVSVRVNITAETLDGSTASAGVIYYSQCSSSWSHNPIENFSPSSVLGKDITAMRIVSVAMLFKNTASPLNQQGLLWTLQADTNEDWYLNYANAGTFNSNSPGTGFFNYGFSRAEEKNRRLEFGDYSFIQPQDERSFGYGVHVLQGSGGSSPAEISFDLSPNNDFLILGASTTNNLGGDCFLEVYQHVEFKSQDPFLERRKPTLTSDQWKAAILAVKSMRQHYPNPIHIRELLGNIVRSVGTYSPIAAEIAGLLPGFGGTASSIIKKVGAGARMLSSILSPEDKMDAEQEQARKRIAVEKAEQAAESAGRVSRPRGRYRGPTAAQFLRNRMNA